MPPPMHGHTVESVCDIFGTGPVSALFEITPPSPRCLCHETQLDSVSQIHQDWSSCSEMRCDFSLTQRGFYAAAFNIMSTDRIDLIQYWLAVYQIYTDDPEAGCLL